jgi:nucleotide-binding universal stress UspA family protein
MIEALLQKGKYLRRILLATDGSEYSQSAIEVAIQVAKQSQARLTVMTMVLLAEDLEMVGTHAMRASQEKQAHQRLDAVAKLAAEAGVPCQTLLCYGEEPYREIVDTAEDIEANLIVMGRRGSRGLARLMVGDATARVIGHAHCNVLVVPRAGKLWKNRITLGTDGSDHSEGASAAAINWAEHSQLPLSIVSATVRSHSRERKAEAQAAASKVESVAIARGLRCEIVVAEGRPEEVITNTAAEKNADLIVVGSHGRSGIARILLGSVSERVIGAATCPVLVAKL